MPDGFVALEGTQALLGDWSRSLSFEFLFNRHSLWSKPIVQIIQWFLMDQIVL